MAITATLAITPSSCAPRAQVVVNVTVSNSGSSSVNVTNIVPLCSPTGLSAQSTAVDQGQPLLSAAVPVDVPASGSRVFTWTIVPLAPTSGSGEGGNPASFVYDVGCTVYTSDGSVTTPSVANLTVTAPTWPG